MKIRIYEGTSVYKDIDNVSDHVKEIQRIYAGGRILDVAGDLGGDVVFRRTDEVEQGRVVFREV